MKTHRPIASGPRLASLFTAALACLPGSAMASEFFGQPGEVFLGGASSLNAFTWRHQTDSDGSGVRNDLSFGLSPSLGVFVVKNLFVGADLEFGVSLPGKDPRQIDEIIDVSEKSRNVYGLAVGPRMGYNIDFGRGVSLMPSLGIGYGLRREVGENYHSLHADVKLPFVFQIAQHGAILVGPQARYSTPGDQLANPLPATFALGLTGGLLIWI